MKPRWDRIQEIYHAALALPRSERSAFVEKACAGDAELLREVISLLKAADSSGVLDTPVMTLSATAESLVGATIGERYFVERELGRSAMSQVYFARDLRLQQQAVVVKVLSQELVQDPSARQRFEREVEALLRIEHSGVVRVQDTGELADGRPYIVMPYVHGEMLRSELTSEGMDLERTASILQQIGVALDHVHERGIFHRDLKPENIIIRRGTDSVVLIDFGIAKVQHSLIASTTAHGPSAGTLRYMSPEQLLGKNVTAESDIYSMGIVAYEMVTGRRPFNPTSSSHMLELQRAGVRARPKYLRDDLSAKADRCITRALKFEPRARYQRASEFGDQLAGALLEPRKPPSAIPTWAKVTGSLIILAVLSYIVARYVDRRDPRPTRSFTYSLTVQEMHDGKEYQAPYKSNGEEIFARDAKFQLSISGSEPGYLYVFNEGPSELNDTNFTMVYPSTATNSGSASLGANQTVQSDWITFRGPAGNENFWMVWSVSPVSQLESAKTEAFKHPRGGLTGESLMAVKEFLRLKQQEVDVTVFHYKARQEAVVRGKGDMLITLAQFKHR
jgi:serine/threonine protein kinase